MTVQPGVNSHSPTLSSSQSVVSGVPVQLLRQEHPSCDVQLNCPLIVEHDQAEPLQSLLEELQ